MIVQNLHQVALHQVGSKYMEEDILLSEELLEITDEIKENLATYFTRPFKAEELYRFYHPSDLEMNEVFNYVTKIFTDKKELLQKSKDLCRHLYEISTHPKIKAGEFYVVLFKDCVLEGKTIDAIGLFKSENKDTFLKIKRKAGTFKVESDTGTNINKLDKGCLVFNMEKENGFVVTVVDSTNKGSEARYWIDDFLRLRERSDEFSQTSNALQLCKKFIKDEMPKDFEVSKAEEAEFLTRSVKFFKEHDSFNLDDFGTEVIAQPEVIDKFKTFKSTYETEREIELGDDFAISAPAVKKQAKIFKSIIKLDKNFHIYVHGNPSLIQRGEDEHGKFYKVYFREET